MEKTSTNLVPPLLKSVVDFEMGTVKVCRYPEEKKALLKEWQEKFTPEQVEYLVQEARKITGAK